MDEKEFEKIWISLDNRINKINERTKNHTLYLRELNKRLKKLENKWNGTNN